MKNRLKAKILSLRHDLPIPLRIVDEKEARQDFFTIKTGYIRVEMPDEKGYSKVVYATLDEEEFAEHKEDIEFAIRLNNMKNRKTIKNCIVLITALIVIGLVLFLIGVTK